MLRTYLLHNGQHPRLCVVIPVSTDSLVVNNIDVSKPGHKYLPPLLLNYDYKVRDTILTDQINLVGVLVGPVSSHKTEESILGSLRHEIGREVGS